MCMEDASSFNNECLRFLSRKMKDDIEHSTNAGWRGRGIITENCTMSFSRRIFKLSFRDYEIIERRKK